MKKPWAGAAGEAAGRQAAAAEAVLQQARPVPADWAPGQSAAADLVWGSLSFTRVQRVGALGAELGSSF